MGGQSGKLSGSNYGNVFVMTDKAYYLAGDNVTGHVYVNIVNYYPGDCVFLKLKGFESSWWREQYQQSYLDSQNNTQFRTEYRYHSATNKFYNHRFCIHSWGQSLPPGQYAFPFSFLLNNHLPGTFLEESSEYKAVIKYKIKAEILPHDKNIGKIKHHQVMVLHEPVKQLIGMQDKQTIKNLTTWCCFNKGTIDIRCHFQSNVYHVGDNAVIIDEIDNSKSQLKVKNIEVILKQNLLLKSTDGHSKVFQHQVNNLNFLGLDAGQSKTGDNRSFHNVQLKNRDNQPLNPSTNGQYVQSQYMLVLKCQMEGCTCCSNDPYVEIPITLVQPPLPNFGQVEQPQNWNPQVFQVQNIVFDNNMIYQPRAQPDQVVINIQQQYQPPQQQYELPKQQYQPPQQQYELPKNDANLQIPLLQGQQQQYQPPR